eukprot:Sspe_Gene.34834::Locus_16912_Transcript_1_6_Confidence_0.300_Length_1299::g.34834::m.34834
MEGAERARTRRDAFSVFDLEGSGVIPAVELQCVLANCPELAEVEITNDELTWAMRRANVARGGMLRVEQFSDIVDNLYRRKVLGVLPEHQRDDADQQLHEATALLCPGRQPPPQAHSSVRGHHSREGDTTTPKIAPSTPFFSFLPPPVTSEDVLCEEQPKLQHASRQPQISNPSPKLLALQSATEAMLRRDISRSATTFSLGGSSRDKTPSVHPSHPPQQCFVMSELPPPATADTVQLPVQLPSRTSQTSRASQPPKLPNHPHPQQRHGSPDDTSASEGQLHRTESHKEAQHGLESLGEDRSSPHNTAGLRDLDRTGLHRDGEVNGRDFDHRNNLSATHHRSHHAQDPQHHHHHPQDHHPQDHHHNYNHVQPHHHHHHHRLYHSDEHEYHHHHHHQHH